MLKQKKNYNSTTLIATQNGPVRCPVCSEAHKIYRCQQFKTISIQDRYNINKKHKLCFNCFSTAHSVYECKASLCRHCQRKHNSMLHGLPYQKKSTEHTPEQNQPASSTACPDNIISMSDNNEINSSTSSDHCHTS